MTAQTIPADKAELADQLSARGLVNTIADRRWRRRDGDHAALLETVATILNGTDAPPIDLNIEQALAELEGPQFFTVQHVLCDLIPRLNVAQDVLLAFVARLVDAGRDDLAAGAPSFAFGEWTKKKPDRAAMLYLAVRSGNELALRQLWTVLRVNADVDEALAFAQADEREAKLAAISALGVMEVGERYAEVLETLLQSSESEDEVVALRSLEAAYRAAAERKTPAPPDFDTQLDRAFKTRSPFAIHVAADLLGRQRDGLSEEAVELSFGAVAHVDPSSNGTISNIDHALDQFVGTGHIKRVVRLLAELIDRSEGRITLEAFQSTCHALKDAGSEVLGDAIVYWLLEGEVHTRKCVAGEVCGVGNDDPPFAIKASSLPADPADQLFLCRKATGWFFIDPLAAVTIPLAVLSNGSPDITNDVLDLIYDPLLLSYGGKLKDYLERYIADGGANGSALTELMARKAELQDAMEGIERLVELHPTETQREAEHVQWQEQMERGMDEGRRKSVLDDLFAKQYILYGRSSLTPIYNGDGTAHLSEIEMKSISISSELPLLNIVDPVGLDHTLWNLKLERRAQS